MATATNSPSIVELDRLRTAEQRRREREQVDAAVASELDLVLRGLPYAENVMLLAEGELANLHVVLLVAAPAAARQLAALKWLDTSGDELDARSSTYDLVMTSRDPRRESIRRERAYFAN